MKTPRINKLRYLVDVLAGDAQTVILASVPAGMEDLTTFGNKRMEQAQAVTDVTTHVFTLRYTDSVDSSCYLLVNSSALYAVDYITDPGEPFRGMFLEVYAHEIQDGRVHAANDFCLEDGTDILVLEDGHSFLLTER